MIFDCITIAVEDKVEKSNESVSNGHRHHKKTKKSIFLDKKKHFQTLYVLYSSYTPSYKALIDWQKKSELLRSN